MNSDPSEYLLPSGQFAPWMTSMSCQRSHLRGAPTEPGATVLPIWPEL